MRNVTVASEFRQLGSGAGRSDLHPESEFWQILTTTGANLSMSPHRALLLPALPFEESE
jgi:hypothetical protein